MSSMFFRRSLSLSNSLLISGSARGGTTWLGEVLNSDNDYKVIFEPFSRVHNPKWPGPDKPYLRDNDDFKHKKLMQRILSGRLDHNWAKFADRGNPKADKVMIKEIRVNAMLAWIQKNFPDLKIIHITRDPYSVAYSCAERGWGPEVVSAYLSQKRFVEDNLSERHVELLDRAGTLFQQNVAKWAIESYLVIKNVARNDMVTSVFYEWLVEAPEQEFKRLADFCGHGLALSSVTRKSRTAGKDSVVDAKSTDFGRRWENQITAADKEYADALIEAFGLSRLYPERNAPGYKQPLDLVL